MRWLCFILIGGMLCAGCASQKTAPSDPDSDAKKAKRKASVKTTAKVKPSSPSATNPSLTVTNGNTVITLTDAVAGKVVSANPTYRFVVLDYSLHRLPAVGDRLNVYRQGLKVGVVRISGPERNNIIAADLLEGEAQAGDEVRPN